MTNRLQLKRGARAQIDAAAANAQLRLGEPYLITDEARLAVGITASAYVAMAKETELSSGGLEEAPSDGTPYLRQDGAWVAAPSTASPNRGLALALVFG